jgi:hypothetical protein
MLSFFFGCLAAATQEDSPGWDPRSIYRVAVDGFKALPAISGHRMFRALRKTNQNLENCSSVCTISPNWRRKLLAAAYRLE